MKRRSPIRGIAPGTIHIDPQAPFPVIDIMGYGEERFEEGVVPVERLPELLRRWPTVWVNVSGLGDEATLRQVAGIFGLHRLILEDVVNVGQRPKVERFDRELFVIAEIPFGGDGDTEQLSLLFGEGFVLTFQERAGDCFDGVRQRIREGKGKLRRSGADYLVYCLLDSVIDAYFPVLDRFGERLDELENEVLAAAGNEIVPEIHRIKRQMVKLRRAVLPHREALNALMRESDQVISAETQVYLRDCYDHLSGLIERLEIYVEIQSNLMATHLSMVSNRMNEVMKVLTIIATIFIPLGFIAGVYGMNFNPDASPFNMPELDWFWGYPIALLLMAGVAGGLVLFFKRKGWFD